MLAEAIEPVRSTSTRVGGGVISDELVDKLRHTEALPRPCELHRSDETRDRVAKKTLYPRANIQDPQIEVSTEHLEICIHEHRVLYFATLERHILKRLLVPAARPALQTESDVETNVVAATMPRGIYCRAPQHGKLTALARAEEHLDL